MQIQPGITHKIITMDKEIKKPTVDKEKLEASKKEKSVNILKPVNKKG